MTSLKYSVASLAMLLASGMAYAEDATTTTTQPAIENKIECPAAGTVAEADLPAECKNQAASEVPKQDNTAATTAPSDSTAVNPATSVLASQFMGQTVYSGEENVGEINDLVMNKELDNFVAIIGVGGFLGIGEKDVAIPIGDITATKDANNNLRLTIAATKEQLEAAPAFDRAALSSSPSMTQPDSTASTATTDPATSTTATTELPKPESTTSATTTTETDPAATATTELPKPDSTTAATTTTETDPAATATTEIPKQDSTTAATTTTETDPAATASTELPKPDSTTAATTTETDPAATATTELPKPDATATTTTTAESQTDPAVTPEAVKQDSATVTETTTATAEMPKPDTTTVTTTAEDTTTGATPDVNPATAVLASQFMGQTVYSTGNENVGEINDLVMSKDLDNVVAIIGVGGFLGIGEKDVAIPVGDLTASKDENNNLRLTISATKEQLEAAPVFDRTALR